MRTTAPERSIRDSAARAFGGAALLAVISLLAACEAPRGTIGAVIAQDSETGRLFVRDVPRGLAADKAGIQAGDEILLIDGLGVRGMSSHQVHAALSGDVDATVKLTLVRGERILRVTLQRTEARRLIRRKSATSEE